MKGWRARSDREGRGFPRARGLRWAPVSKTRILPEPAPIRLLIGHWKLGLAREEQHPPLTKIGRRGAGCKAADRQIRFVWKLLWRPSAANYSLGTEKIRPRTISLPSTSILQMPSKRAFSIERFTSSGICSSWACSSGVGVLHHDQASLNQGWTSKGRLKYLRSLLAIARDLKYFGALCMVRSAISASKTIARKPLSKESV
jgi:hypothetical protein